MEDMPMFIPLEDDSPASLPGKKRLAGAKAGSPAGLPVKTPRAARKAMLRTRLQTRSGVAKGAHKLSRLRSCSLALAQLEELQNEPAEALPAAQPKSQSEHSRQSDSSLHPAPSGDPATPASGPSRLAGPAFAEAAVAWRPQGQPGFRSLPAAKLGGVVFGCTGQTQPECLRRRLFGLPEHHMVYVRNITPGLPLYLFNYEDRTLQGTFSAASIGVRNLEGYAWGTPHTLYGRFPAQVKTNREADFPALREEHFKLLLAENYYDSKCFNFELTHKQAAALNTLLAAPASRRAAVAAAIAAIPPDPDPGRIDENGQTEHQRYGAQLLLAAQATGAMPASVHHASPAMRTALRSVRRALARADSASAGRTAEAIAASAEEHSAAAQDCGASGEQHLGSMAGALARLDRSCRSRMSGATPASLSSPLRKLRAYDSPCADFAAALATPLPADPDSPTPAAAKARSEFSLGGGAGGADAAGAPAGAAHAADSFALAVSTELPDEDAEGEAAGSGPAAAVAAQAGAVVAAAPLAAASAGAALAGLLASTLPAALPAGTASAAVPAPTGEQPPACGAPTSQPGRAAPLPLSSAPPSPTPASLRAILQLVASASPLTRQLARASAGAVGRAGGAASQAGGCTATRPPQQPSLAATSAASPGGPPPPPPGDPPPSTSRPFAAPAAAASTAAGAVAAQCVVPGSSPAAVLDSGEVIDLTTPAAPAGQPSPEPSGDNMVVDLVSPSPWDDLAAEQPQAPPVPPASLPLQLAATASAWAASPCTPYPAPHLTPASLPRCPSNGQPATTQPCPPSAVRMSAVSLLQLAASGSAAYTPSSPCSYSPAIGQQQELPSNAASLQTGPLQSPTAAAVPLPQLLQPTAPPLQPPLPPASAMASPPPPLPTPGHASSIAPSPAQPNPPPQHGATEQCPLICGPHGSQSGPGVGPLQPPEVQASRWGPPPDQAPAQLPGPAAAAAPPPAAWAAIRTPHLMLLGHLRRPGLSFLDSAQTEAVAQLAAAVPLPPESQAQLALQCAVMVQEHLLDYARRNPIPNLQSLEAVHARALAAAPPPPLPPDVLRDQVFGFGMQARQAAALAACEQARGQARQEQWRHVMLDLAMATPLVAQRLQLGAGLRVLHEQQAADLAATCEAHKQAMVQAHVAQMQAYQATAPGASLAPLLPQHDLERQQLARLFARQGQLLAAEHATHLDAFAQADSSLPARAPQPAAAAAPSPQSPQKKAKKAGKAKQTPPPPAAWLAAEAGKALDGDEEALLSPSMAARVQANTPLSKKQRQRLNKRLKKAPHMLRMTLVGRIHKNTKKLLLAHKLVQTPAKVAPSVVGTEAAVPSVTGASLRSILCKPVVPGGYAGKALFAFDTNVYMNAHFHYVVEAWVRAAPAAPVRSKLLLIPRVVPAELSTLGRKSDKADTRLEAQQGLRFLQGLRTLSASILLDQEFGEWVWPEACSRERTADDGILDCMRWFAAAGASVTLVSSDQQFLARAHDHGLSAMLPEMLADDLLHGALDLTAKPSTQDGIGVTAASE